MTNYKKINKLTRAPHLLYFSSNGANKLLFLSYSKILKYSYTCFNDTINRQCFTM